MSLLPKTAAGFANIAAFAKAENAMYRVIRGTAEFKDAAGKRFALAADDTVTAGKTAASRVATGEDKQILRLGLLKGLADLRKWTAAKRDAIDGLGDRIITRREIRPLRTGRVASPRGIEPPTRSLGTKGSSFSSVARQRARMSIDQYNPEFIALSCFLRLPRHTLDFPPARVHGGCTEDPRLFWVQLCESQLPSAPLMP